jgi:hypothetical protein
MFLRSHKSSLRRVYFAQYSQLEIHSALIFQHECTLSLGGNKDEFGPLVRALALPLLVVLSLEALISVISLLLAVRAIALELLLLGCPALGFSFFLLFIVSTIGTLVAVQPTVVTSPFELAAALLWLAHYRCLFFSTVIGLLEANILCLQSLLELS